jgi:zinc transporter ZupT
MISPKLAAWAVAYGLLIWFEATVIVRWVGNYVFVPGNTFWAVVVFTLTAPLVFAIGWFFFAAFKTKPLERAIVTILICAAGLVADAFVFVWIENVFPVMSATQERMFASWLLWAYGLGLLSGVWPAKLPRVPTE